MREQTKRSTRRRAGAVALRRLHAGLGHVATSVHVRLKRPVTLGVRVLALNARDEVLLVRHSYRPGLMLPGGGVDPGESCREAAVRECAEEAGLRFDRALDLFHVYFNRALANRDHVALFVGRNAQQPAPPKPGLEILSARFYPLDALPEDVTRASRARIAEVMSGAVPADDW